MHAFWEIVGSNALLVAVLAIGAGLLGRIWKNPAALHLLWLCVLVKFLTPPLVTIPVCLPSTPASCAVANSSVDQDTATELQAGTPDKAPVYPHTSSPGDRIVQRAAAVPGRPNAEILPAIGRWTVTRWQDILAWLWVLGIVLLACRHAFRILRFRKLLRSAQAPSSAVLAMVEAIGKQLGLHRIPETWMLPVRISPLVWFFGWRPRVVLPAPLFARLDAQAQETILAHEVAHIRRRDHWIRLLELAVTTLFWWHPVVWWARRELQELEDQCCDAIVLSLTPHGARTYATALVDTLDFLSESPVAVPLGATAARSFVSLSRRIKMLENPVPAIRLTAGRLLLMLAVVALPMAVAFAATPPEPSNSGASAQRGKESAAVDETPDVRITLRILEVPRQSDLVRQLHGGGVILNEVETKKLLETAQDDGRANVLQAPVVTTRLGQCALVSTVWRKQQLVCQVMPEAAGDGDAIALRIKPESSIPESDDQVTLTAREVHWNDPERTKWRTSIRAKLKKGEGVVFGGWDDTRSDVHADHVVVFLIQASLTERPVGAAGPSGSEGAKAAEKPATQCRAVNKLVKDFPKADLSTPESATAAYRRVAEGMDPHAGSEFRWWQYGPKEIEAFKEATRNVSRDVIPRYQEAVLNAEILEVITYRDDLACVIGRSQLRDSKGHPTSPMLYYATLLGRIGDVWKVFDGYGRSSVEVIERKFERDRESFWQAFLTVRDRVQRALPVPPPRSIPMLDRAKRSEIEKWQRETWQLRPTLDAPDLATPAVQWAIFDRDPLPGFQQRVRQAVTYYRGRLAQAKTEADKEMQRSVAMTVDWDLGFKDVTGDRLYLLQSGEGTSTVSSNGPGGKKWIVTKISQTDDGRPVCWCMPVELEKGSQVDVTLTEDNMFDLGQEFDNALEEANEGK